MRTGPDPDKLKSTASGDPTSPERIPLITGLEYPFDKITSKLTEILEENKIWDGIRVPLEESLKYIKDQKLIATQIKHYDIEDFSPMLDRFNNGEPMLASEDYQIFKNDFPQIFKDLLLSKKYELEFVESFIQKHDENLLEQFLSEPAKLIDSLTLNDDADDSALIYLFVSIRQVLAVTLAEMTRGAVEFGIWNIKNCPICGNDFEMARVSANGGHYYLVCSLCMTEWKTTRLECPHCLNTNQKTLGYFTVGEYPHYVVNYCKECNTYVKASIEKEMGRRHIPSLDNLLTLELDFIAQKEGFNREFSRSI